MANIQDFINKIVTRKFSQRAKGYDPKEVDETFDELLCKINEISDENISLKKKFDLLSDEFNELKINNDKLKMQNANLEAQVEEFQKSGYHNEAIARRVQEIEKQMKNNK